MGVFEAGIGRKHEFGCASRREVVVRNYSLAVPVLAILAHMQLSEWAGYELECACAATVSAQVLRRL